MSTSSRKKRASARRLLTFDAVLDTNVMLEIYTCADLFNTYRDRNITLADIDDNDHAVRRRARAQNSILLADYLHHTGARTYGLTSEFLAKLQAIVPPDAGDDKTSDEGLLRHFNLMITKQVIHFLKDNVLSDWQHEGARKPDGLRSNPADKALIAFAKERGLPLISNETVGKMRRTALADGVAIFTPGEFIADKVDRATAIPAFLGRFEAATVSYIAAEPPAEREQTKESLLWMHGVYKHVLTGETVGRAPVTVTHPRV